MDAENNASLVFEWPHEGEGDMMASALITTLAALRVKKVFVAWNGFDITKADMVAQGSLYWILPRHQTRGRRNGLTRVPESDFGMQAGSSLALVK